jgi:hypothetical protein
MLDKNLVEQYYNKLVRELERTSVRSLLYTLLCAVKESGSTGPKGVIICALLMVYVLLSKDKTPKHRDFLIFLILAHKEIVLANTKTDSDSKAKKIHHLKCVIYKKICEIFFQRLNTLNMMKCYI